MDRLRGSGTSATSSPFGQAVDELHESLEAASLVDELLPDGTRVPEYVGKHRECGLLEESIGQRCRPLAESGSHPGTEVPRADLRRPDEVVTKRWHRSHLPRASAGPASAHRPPPIPPGAV